MDEIISEGKSVSEAVDKALSQAGLRRDQVEVKILQEASSGFIGIGSKPARVCITEKLWKTAGAGDEPTPPEKKAPAAPRPRAAHKDRAKGRESSHKRPAIAPPEPPAPRPSQEPKTAAGAIGAKIPLDGEQIEEACAAGSETVKEILALMKFPVTSLKSSWDMEQERIKVEVETADSEQLIGKEGRTLESLQFLTTLIVSRRFKVPIAVWVDTQGYWRRRETAILSQARQGVETVKTTGKSFRMSPMDPAMRRLVHRSLAGNPDVLTVSEGLGPWRKIVLKPRT